MIGVAEALVAMHPRVVHVSGGEPLIVKGLLDAVERIARAGVAVVMSTSGYGLNDELLDGIARLFHSVHVSVDGASAETHDRIRGRAGSFDTAMAALGKLDALSRRRRAAGERPIRFGIDYVVLRSNFDELERLITDVTPQFGELEWVIFNGVVPQGLASRESYDRELPTDEQMRRLGDLDFAEALQAKAREPLRVFLRDNLDLQMHPKNVQAGTDWTLDRIIVEPDGQVRALEVYEGHVGNVLSEPLEVLWQRVLDRRDDPFVVEQLRAARNMSEWAAAVRNIDQRFASPPDLVRIAKRKPYAG
jgi:MoaA/NifB/PqqE/SkfB family radical SAM enzyme